jgi:hypothetical protein
LQIHLLKMRRIRSGMSPVRAVRIAIPKSFAFLANFFQQLNARTPGRQGATEGARRRKGNTILGDLASLRYLFAAWSLILIGLRLAALRNPW